MDSTTNQHGPRLFFLNDTATPELYPLSLHDALPIPAAAHGLRQARRIPDGHDAVGVALRHGRHGRSEEHTSELQSLAYLVCRLLLAKKRREPHELRSLVLRARRVFDQAVAFEQIRHP